jgi:hypothetical protein
MAQAQNFDGLWAQNKSLCHQRSGQTDTWMHITGTMIVGNKWRCFVNKRQGNDKFAIVNMICGYDKTDIMFSDIMTITRDNDMLHLKYDHGHKTFVKCKE